MNRRTSLKALFTIALALQIPSPASACRHGWDQHLLEESPPPDVLPGAQVIRVNFSNARPALDRWPRSTASLDGSPFDYWLIGVAQIIGEGAARQDYFPVYAFVTSCSGFSGIVFGEVRTVVEGEYYLIGRFAADESGRRFHAGRVHRGGGASNGQWHF